MTILVNKCLTPNYWRVTFMSVIVMLTSRAIATGLLNTLHNPILSSSSMSNSFQDTSANNDAGIPCYIEYQVTKQKSGRCVKLGSGVRGCLADSYINPFHPDCS
ncbi:hypothetical protein PV328_006248 [Microctonus aethiopoides]|uniref:Uncharacterized protein n=1 Tax=Microctonus aethiopoides TaxID=144406 RepID=A0AA39KTG8_9HYME|nr:hypothetical protein PV328_006248 [Microctonus aethiopoides]